MVIELSSTYISKGNELMRNLLLYFRCSGLWGACVNQKGPGSPGHAAEKTQVEADITV